MARVKTSSNEIQRRRRPARELSWKGSPVRPKETFGSSVRPKGFFRRTDDVTRLVNSMNLDEMLEASIIVERGIKEEKIPVIKSMKAREYARIVLRLNGKVDTKSKAEEMMQNLAAQISNIVRSF